MTRLIRSEKVRRALILFLLVASTIIAFIPVTQSGFVNYDDPGYVTANQHVRSGLSAAAIAWAFTSTVETNWHPLTWISHQLDCTLFGMDPWFHHAMNLLLHVVSTILLFMAFERMTGEIWKSAFVAFVFALHPLHVQSVAWIAERKDVLSGLFWMLALLAYVEYRKHPTRSRYLSVLVIFALGLLSKPMLVTLPFVFILIDYWPLDHFHPFKETLPPGTRWSEFGRNLREKTPFFILSLASSVVTYIVQQQGRAMISFLVIPFPERVANGIVSYGEYILKTALPIDLAVFYPHPTDTLPLLNVVGSLAGLIVISAANWRWRTRYPFLIVGWLWFLGTLIPVIGIVQVGFQAYADRYMYLPLTGLSVMIAWGVPALAATQRWNRHALKACFAVIVLLMMIQTTLQASYWQNSRRLLEHARSVTHGNYIADNNLGVDLADSGDHAGAIAYLREAIRYDPTNIAAYHNLARSLLATGATDEAVSCYDRIASLGFGNAQMEAFAGSLLAKEGKVGGAIEHYLASLRFNDADVNSRYRLADLYLKAGSPEEARKQCALALKVAPYNSGVHDILGKIDASEQRLNDALREFQEAIRCDSGNADAYNDSGILYDQSGNTAKAWEMFSAAVRVDSMNWNAHFNLGTALAKQGRLDVAEHHWLRAADLNPGFADIHINLGKLYTIQDRIDSAAKQLKLALRLDSANVQAHYNYGNLLLKQGLRDAAAAEFADALRLAPAFEPARSALAKLRKQ